MHLISLSKGMRYCGLPLIWLKIMPVQIIHEKIDFSIPVLRMEEGKAIKHIRNFIQPFDLKKAPLFRVEIIELSVDHYLLLFDAHHIIIDAFSMEILKREILEFYTGKIPEPLKIQYKDYAIWQNNFLKKRGNQKTESLVAGTIPGGCSGY